MVNSCTNCLRQPDRSRKATNRPSVTIERLNIIQLYFWDVEVENECRGQRVMKRAHKAESMEICHWL